jgi:MOSC domain-containing protein YiiM
LVLDATADELTGLLQQRMVVGSTEIQITGKPSNCPGVYASVLRPGTISVGDHLEYSGR